MKKTTENKKNSKGILAVALAAVLTAAIAAPAAATKTYAAVEAAQVFGNAIESLAANTISMAKDLASGEYDEAKEVVISTADKFGYGLGVASVTVQD